LKESSKTEIATDKVRRKKLFIMVSSFQLLNNILAFEGKYFYSDGGRYEGEFKNNKFNG